MKMRKIISVLASLSLAASCFAAFATSASAVIENATETASISVDAVKITDFTGDYADYADYDMTADGLETYLLTFNVTGVELETTLGTGMSKTKASGTSISSWTIKYTVNTTGTKDEDWMLEDISTSGSETMNMWVGNAHTLSYGNGSSMIYPASGTAAKATAEDKIPVYTAIAVINPENTFEIEFSGCAVLVSLFEKNAYTGKQEDNVEYKQLTDTLTAKSVVLPVSESDVPVESVTLDKSTLALDVYNNATAKLTATVAPDNATDPTVTWTTDAAGVATVADDGTVTAVAVGTATITAKAGDKSATCEVTVTDSTPVTPTMPTKGTVIVDAVDGKVVIYADSKDASAIATNAKFEIVYTGENEALKREDGTYKKEIKRTFSEILGGEIGEGKVTGKVHFGIKIPDTVPEADRAFFTINVK